MTRHGLHQFSGDYLEIAANAIRQHRLTTVEDYYGWGAQAFSLAPPWDRLSESARVRWRDEFAQAIRHTHLHEKSRRDFLPGGLNLAP